MDHIRGATFRKLCTYKNDAGVVQDIATVGIKSQIRTQAGQLVSEVVINKLSPTSNGQYTMLVANTTAWPCEQLVQDIQYTVSGTIVYTDKLEINVSEQVTL